MTREYNNETFSVFVPEMCDVISFHCWTTDQHDGFCHYCYCGAIEDLTSKNATTRVKYYNRTWETFRYESVLRQAIDKFPKAMRQYMREQLIERKSNEARAKAEEDIARFKQLHDGLTERQKEILKDAPLMETEKDMKSIMAIMGFMNAMNNLGADK